MAAEASAARVALVTGGSSGIGRETARGLGAHFDVVAIVGRNEERLANAAADLRGSGVAVETFQADFSSLTDVRRLAKNVKDRFASLSLLVNNAGLWNRDRAVSRDGYEETFAVNHLAHFLLTNELKELLVNAAPSRVVNVSSSMHARPHALNWDDLMFERTWRGGFWAYGHSKLANVLFSNELARRWQHLQVTSNALHPGNVRSQITRQSVLLNALHRSRIVGLFILSEAEGAATPLYVATAPELAEVTGRYFVKKRQSAPSRAARDPVAAARLWEISERLVAIALESDRSSRPGDG